MTFVWDDTKDLANQKKHGISFSDARNVFADPLALIRVDHHTHEVRWQILGHWGVKILVLVVYTERKTDGTEQMRIISARRASTTERRQYEKGTWF